MAHHTDTFPHAPRTLRGQEHSEWAIILASQGDHDKCVEILRDAGWGNELANGGVADDRGMEKDERTVNGRAKERDSGGESDPVS